MIIQNSSIQMSVEHTRTESRLETRTFSAAPVTDFTDFLEGAWFGINQATEQHPSAGLTGQTQNQIMEMTERGFQFRTEPKSDQQVLEQYKLTRKRLFEALIEAILPRKNFRLAVATEQPIPAATEVNESTQAQASTQPRLRPVGFKLDLQVTEKIEEYECSSFNSCGFIQTQEGDEINFSLSLTQERSYSSSREYQSTELVFKDPLILNFEGEATELSDERYSFDLDADGQPEMISYLRGLSGMLALDKNDDSTINDGSELFGALTGDGFAELAAYDEDGNQFIDSGDSIFEDLKLWYKTPETESLISLADKGIGAIYLGSAISPFEIKGADNQTNGRVLSTGVYLTDSGSAGTVQQIDMAV